MSHKKTKVNLFGQDTRVLDDNPFLLEYSINVLFFLGCPGMSLHVSESDFGFPPVCTLHSMYSQNIWLPDVFSLSKISAALHQEHIIKMWYSNYPNLVSGAKHDFKIIWRGGLRSRAANLTGGIGLAFWPMMI